MSTESGQLSWTGVNVARPASHNPLRDLVYSPEDELLDNSTEIRSTGGGEDRFQNRYQSARKTFETWQPKQGSPQSPKSSISGDSSVGAPASSPVGERIENFSSLKKRFEKDANNNTSAPRSMKYSSYNVVPTRLSWDGSSTPGSSRRSSESSTELNERQRRSSEIANEMASIRERIVVAKVELAEANERREAAKQGYAEAKHRTIAAKQKSKSLREQARSMEELIERKEKKIGEFKKKLEARTARVEHNKRALAYYDKETRNESGLVEEARKNVEATRARRKATIEKIRQVAPGIEPLKKAIIEVEDRTEKARRKSRRFQDILNKSTIKLKNARTLSAEAAQRVSFKGYRIEDAHKTVSAEKERTKRAKADISYLEYRKQLLGEQIEEYNQDIRKLLLRANPHSQQKALGFVYTRLPMSEEL